MKYRSESLNELLIDRDFFPYYFRIKMQTILRVFLNPSIEDDRDSHHCASASLILIRRSISTLSNHSAIYYRPFLPGLPRLEITRNEIESALSNKYAERTRLKVRATE